MNHEDKHRSSVYTRRHEPISFYYVDQIIGSRIGFPNGNIDVIDPIFAEDSFDFVLVDVRERYGIRNRDASFFLSANDDSRRAFV